MFADFRSVFAIVVLLCLTLTSMAQPPVPANFTNGQQETYDAWLSVPTTERSMTISAALLPLTTSANASLPAQGLSGPAVLADSTSQLDAHPQNIVLISCDSSSYFGGIIDATYLLQQAESAEVTAIVLYSEQSDYCNYSAATENDNYLWLYTLQSSTASQSVLGTIDAIQKAATGNITEIAIERNGTGISNGGLPQSGRGSSGSGDDGGPPPSTAVAMIILYSITGIITGLFLVVIITGAVRAHRHPERYGPRNILGRARQSRAQGLARAMLDSLPIVKFGEQGRAKPGDVELTGGNSDIPASNDATQSRTQVPLATVTSDEREAGKSSVHSTVREETGIEPASAECIASSHHSQETEGCSICTEDFELGQDQRVLPCDHRFHPSCIDPWLLNISGTCPLCRIDLRPPTSGTDENIGDGPVDGMLPPLVVSSNPADRERLSMRRSLMLSIMGLGQMERMSRQQRIMALREFNQQRAQDPHGPQSQTLPGALPEEEASTRRRLRNAFRIRTRRVGHGNEEAA